MCVCVCVWGGGRLNQHAADHNVFVSEQFGFRQQSSTNIYYIMYLVCIN
jgi:hypothetical protein